ncbi:MAG: peptidase S41, partial [Burkholderiaceae bacterium]
ELYKQDPNLKGLVLDLRNDPGGYLEGAVAISAAFLPKDALVVSTRGQLPQMQEVRKANRAGYMHGEGGNDPLADLPAALKKVPLIVLVNEGSASASEIVAGALQDHKRGVLMGSQTFGKGSVQTFRELGPDTGLKITTARYYTPSDRSIQAQGIEPDVYLDDTAEGDVYGALRTREADLDKHLAGANEEERKAREKARDEARRKLEEELRNKTFKPLPEFGSDEDFQLRQALNRLQGKPVKASATLKARPVESAEAEDGADKPRK